MPTAGASRIGALVAEEVQTQGAHDRYITALLLSLILKCRLFVFFNTLLYTKHYADQLSGLDYFYVIGRLNHTCTPVEFFLDLCSESFSLFLYFLKHYSTYGKEVLSFAYKHS